MALLELLANGDWSEVILNSDPDIPADGQRAPDHAAWTPSNEQA